MKDSIIPAQVRTRPDTFRETWLERHARSAVNQLFERLEHGSLTVADAYGTARFGIPGSGLSARIDVHHPAFYRSLLVGGSLGAAESYILGDWSAGDLTALCRLMLRNIDAADAMEGGWARLMEPVARLAHLLRRNTAANARRNIRAHYDLGNDFFALFLDESLTYSSGVFEHPGATLEEASVAKIDRLCRKLELNPQDHLLEIGTGWGAFAMHAAREYGCRVTTTTISGEQFDLARARIREAGLDHRITVLFEDYRKLTGHFDKLVSVEMIEAVGHEYLGAFFGACSRLLHPHGLMALQGITMPDHRYQRYRKSVDFIRKYVFPGSHLPSVGAISSAVAQRTDLRLVNLEDITPHYARTLQLWRDRFQSRTAELRTLGFDEQFQRLWNFYLSYCEAGFAERYTGCLQFVWAKPQARPEPWLAGRPG